MTKNGLTLIEITVALALSALLMATTAGVIKSMQQKKKQIVDRIDIMPWRSELADRLRADIMLANEMRIGTTTIEFAGFCGHDGSTGEPVHTHVQVIWQLKSAGNWTLLTRSEVERNLGPELRIPSRTELVAVGISKISIGTFLGGQRENKEEMQTLSLTSTSLTTSGHWTATPRVVKFIIHGTANNVLVNELVYR
ncbi:MAG: prepilin-type N-terminal cleavage/methylation domain-containing protein [Planctomycetia bacterium]|nr:prepilin-type N-terminal cleavage/methylation domain-containing protein [Planctomycetia bacterium]